MGEQIVKIRDLSVSYGKTKAIEGVSLDIGKGDYLGIIGPNGGGKSTLLKSLAGLIEYEQGQIEITEGTVIGYVPQFSYVDKKFPISLLEVVLMGRINKKTSPFFSYRKEDKDLAYELLKAVGIEKLAKRQISDLSGGEFQKMLIARALAVSPDLLLLDEPTASVDSDSRAHIYELLSKLNEEITIVLATHDMMAVSSELKGLACLNTRLIYYGIPELDQETIDKMYGCPIDLIAPGIPHRVYKEERDHNI